MGQSFDIVIDEMRPCGQRTKQVAYEKELPGRTAVSPNAKPAADLSARYTRSMLPEPIDACRVEGLHCNSSVIVLKGTHYQGFQGSYRSAPVLYFDQQRHLTSYQFERLAQGRDAFVTAKQAGLPQFR